MAPTIVRVAPPSEIARPIAEGSRLNRRSQNVSLTTTTGGPPKRSSSCVNVRPRAGSTPSTEKKRGDVRIASTRSGRGPLVSVMFSKKVAARPTNVWFISFHSSRRTGATNLVDCRLAALDS